jgi:hypothetical protein
MKTLLLTLTLLATANAGVWTTVTTLADKTVKPDIRYTLDTAGLNVRSYVYTVPNSKPVQQCVIVFTESKYKAPVQNCWTKAK